jgi:hypothetical protein
MPTTFPWAGWKPPLAVGFFGLLAAAVTGYFKQFPELLVSRQEPLID